MDVPCLCIKKLNIVKMVMLPKWIYRFYTVPIKIPAEFTCLGTYSIRPSSHCYLLSMTSLTLQVLDNVIVIGPLCFLRLFRPLWQRFSHGLNASPGDHEYWLFPCDLGLNSKYSAKLQHSKLKNNKCHTPKCMYILKMLVDTWMLPTLHI